MKDERCLGCASYEVEDMMGDHQIIRCPIPPRKHGYKCPCRSCLIKMVCTKRCPELDTYMKVCDFSSVIKW
jgi:hypothetical protein